jgi:hypothetical protein
MLKLKHCLIKVYAVPGSLVPELGSDASPNP